MKVISGRNVPDTLIDIGRFYRKMDRDDVGERKVKAILAAIRELAKRQIGHHADNDLPANYRCRIVDTYHIFYLIDHENNTIYVYDVRHGARKPLKPETHRRHASQAKRDNVES